MAVSSFPRWEEIELAESYLICCMFKEASDLSSSILRRIHETHIDKLYEDPELFDIMEAAGMVFVQSLKQLNRTQEIFSELAVLFDSIAAIPVRVLVTGTCFQISEGCISGLQSTLEEYISKWNYSPTGSLYACVEHNVNGGPGPLSLDEYVEVAEAYAVTLLGMALGNTDLAVCWIEKAQIPDAAQQELLSKLHVLITSKASKQTLGTGASLLVEANAVLTAKNPRFAWKSLGLSARQFDSLKTGFAQFIASSARIILWSSLILFVLNILRKKGSIIKRMLAGQALSIRKALLDFWQLAFSVQLNPLAAVQPLPRSSSGG